MSWYILWPGSVNVVYVGFGSVRDLPRHGVCFVSNFLYRLRTRSNGVRSIENVDGHGGQYVLPSSLYSWEEV